MNHSKYFSERVYASLITLLDDTDTEVVEAVFNEICTAGPIIIPRLEESLLTIQCEEVKDLIVKAIRRIRLESIKAEFKLWKKSSNRDLLKAALLLSRFRFPDVDERLIKRKIEEMIADALLEVNYNLHPIDHIDRINRIIFNLHGFKLNIYNVINPEYSFINTLVDSGEGDSLSLSTIYAIIAQKMGLPLFTVNLPHQFALAYVNDYTPNNEVLFYINPKQEGLIFSSLEIDRFLDSMNLEKKQKYYQASTNIEFVINLINNLKYNYSNVGKSYKSDELEEIRAILLE